MDMVDVNPIFIVKKGWRPAKVIQIQHNEILCIYKRYKIKHKLYQSWFNTNNKNEVRDYKTMQHFYFKGIYHNHDTNNDQYVKKSIDEKIQATTKMKIISNNTFINNIIPTSKKCNLCNVITKCDGVLIKHFKEYHTDEYKHIAKNKLPFQLLYTTL